MLHEQQPLSILRRLILLGVAYLGSRLQRVLVELGGTVVYKVLQHEVVIYIIFIIMSRGSHEVLKRNKVLWLIFKCRLRRLFEAVDNIELAYLIRLDAG
jgi:predicted SprT family Zn-dependent metalloprotease